MVKSIKRLIKTTKGLTRKHKHDTMGLLAKITKENKMKSINKKQAKSQASKLGNWILVIIVSVIVLGFAARGVMQYTTGMSDEQRIIASVFVIALCAYVIYVNLKKVIKET